MKILQITSSDNPQYKQLKKVASHVRDRKKLGLTLLDGPHLIKSAYENQYRLEQLIVREDSLEHFEIQDCLALYPDTPVLTLNKSLFNTLSPVESPTGLMATLKIPSSTYDSYCFAVLLENIQDPGNLGGIMRTAAAAGADAIFLSPGCTEAWSPKALRAGMGAQFLLKIHEYSDLVLACKQFDKIIATSLQATQSIYTIDLRGSVAFVFGNEGTGLSTELLQATSHHIQIPMPGKTESLNVAAAVAVCLFEKVRQDSLPK